MNNRFTLFLSVLFVWSPVMAPSEHTISAPTEVFDQYRGAIRWQEERFRLDNFAIQLQQEEKLVGYILVVDAVGGCPGEAQARAIRAKRYVVEHRGIAWNRVIWRREGYQEGLTTVLQPVNREISLRFPFLSTVSRSDGSLSRQCKAKLQQIKSSRW